MVQNSDWSWEEHVLALEFYMRNPSSPPSKTSSEIAELSATLWRLGELTGASMNEKFRNPNGVYMKLMNFRRLDPSFQSQGKSGLAAGSMGEEEVWDRYSNDLEGLQAEAQAIRERVASGATGSLSAPSGSGEVSAEAFQNAFALFQEEVAIAQKGAPFQTFQDGVAAAWEDYKPRLREYALELLDSASWTEEMIGSGRIVDATIAAVEIQDTSKNITNNLVFWQNRFGHASRDHRALLEAQQSKLSLQPLERRIFDLFRNDSSEGHIFEELAELTGRKYPLLAYLFFLKDINRFMPIQPTGFDAAFKQLGVPLRTVRNCSWENYCSYNATLAALQNRLRSIDSLPIVRLVDAHSFCWLLVKLPEKRNNSSRLAQDPGRVIGGKEKSILAIRYSIKETVRRSNGQSAQTNVKNKELRMSDDELDQLIKDLMALQDGRCALTGIPFNFHGEGANKNLLPSPDRIDSDGHYEHGNLQLVCQFVNFWKGASDNTEFAELLDLVRRQAT